MGELKKIKFGKAAIMDSIVGEMLKKGGINILGWLLRIFNVSHSILGDRTVCANYRGISIFYTWKDI